MSNLKPQSDGHMYRPEGLVFEKSATGKRGFELPPLDVPAVDVKQALGAAFARDEVKIGRAHV